MRIHGDKINSDDIRAAAQHAARMSGAAVYVVRSTVHGSRQRAGALDVIIASDGTLSRRRRNAGASRDRSALDDYAATWGQWGHFLAYLFTVDPSATAPTAYADAADFHARTRGEFADPITLAS